MWTTLFVLLLNSVVDGTFRTVVDLSVDGTVRFPLDNVHLLECTKQPPIIIIIIIVISCHRSFLPGTSLEPAVIPTAQASSFTLQYFPYYV